MSILRRYYAQTEQKMKPSISIILITKNSEKTVEKCLESIQWANEIIVLDSGSTDQTLSICLKYTDHVFQTDWPGFGIQKNRALAKATSNWVFSIDSDEWITDALREEMIKTIKNPTALVFQLPRLNQYCGQWIRHGDVGKDKVTRLFKRGFAHFSDDRVHEKIMTSEKIGKLTFPLCHNTYDSIDALLQRMNLYSSLSAKMRFDRGKKTNLLKAIISACWSFTRAYFFRAGFLDGKMGFIVCAAAAQSSYYRHVKLMELMKQRC